MKLGTHIINSAFSENYGNPTTPRRHLMDNGDYRSNFILRQVQLIPTNNQRSGGNQDKFSGETIFFVVSTDEAGAIPVTAPAASLTAGNYDLRLGDTRIIAWGAIAPAYAFNQVVIDPLHVIVEDIYVNAWSIDPAGGLIPSNANLGYVLEFENIKESGTEGLVSRTRQSAID